MLGFPSFTLQPFPADRLLPSAYCHYGTQLAPDEFQPRRAVY